MAPGVVIESALDGCPERDFSDVEQRTDEGGEFLSYSLSFF